MLAPSHGSKAGFGEEHESLSCAKNSLSIAGRCGNGPNLVLEARGEAGSELALSHVSTPAKLAEALRAFTPLDVSEGLLKVSTGFERWRWLLHAADTVIIQEIAKPYRSLARVFHMRSCLRHACLSSTSCWSALECV